MMILDTTSLLKTVDKVNELHLLGEEISLTEGIDIAKWIVTREGLKGSYRGMFAPTDSDFEAGIRVFTGEQLESASARHISGQEAARAAWLLGKTDPEVREAYQRVTRWMPDHAEFQHWGTFCCGKCTLAFWRHYWVGDFPEKETRLVKGLQAMKARRTGDGKWQRFPFFYTIYTLLGIDVDPARAELNYAKPVMERYLKTTHQDTFANRKAAIVRQALEMISG